MKIQIPTTADIVHNGRQLRGHVVEVDGTFCTEKDAKRLVDLGKAVECDDALPTTLTFDKAEASAAAPSNEPTKGEPPSEPAAEATTEAGSKKGR